MDGRADEVKKANENFKKQAKLLTKLLKHVEEQIAEFDKCFERSTRVRAKFVKMTEKTMEMREDLMKAWEEAMDCTNHPNSGDEYSSSRSIEMHTVSTTDTPPNLRRSRRGKGNRIGG